MTEKVLLKIFKIQLLLDKIEGKNEAIPYLHYCIRPRNFLQKDTEPENAQYAYPKRVLDYV